MTDVGRQDAQRDDSSVGLLDLIADTALDDDYYVVQSGRPEPSRRFNTALTGAAFGVFALLVTIVAVQTRTDRPATEREQRALAQDVEVRRSIAEDRRDQLNALRAEVDNLQLAAGADQDTDTLGARTAGVAVTGPGISIRITPGDEGGQVTDGDLQTLVNALWFYGAEAITVDDQRIGTLTSIRQAGEAITVNYQSISPPYTVRAIGDVEQLGDRLEGSRLMRQWREREDATGVRFAVSARTDMRLDAISIGKRAVTHARTVPDRGADS